MYKNQKLKVGMPLLLAGVMIVGMSIGFTLSKNQSGVSFFKNPTASPLNEVVNLIKKDYVDPINTDSIQTDAVNKLLANLDPHSLYIPADQLTEINESIEGTFQGLGIEYQMFNDTVNVIGVTEHGPAEKAGVQVGDKLLLLNGNIALVNKKYTVDSIQHILHDDKSNTASIDILRNGKKAHVNIEKGTVPIPSLDAAYMLDKETGYFKISRFSETTYKEFMFALEGLQKQGLKKMILDLRGNSGGLLDQAVNMADEFLSDFKLIVYTEGAHSPRKEYRCKRNGLFETGKLEVLVDENSASASEVLAGALQDWDRATIIGRRTFGKGLVQEQFDLTNGAALRLTVARYFTPLGRNIQKPYTSDIAAYDDEILQRYQNGELQKNDTSRNHGKAYKTAAGKTVFGGGGISPDIFVPFDTLLQPSSVVELYARGIVNQYAYNYYVAHRSVIHSFPNAQAFAKGFQPEENMWNGLLQVAAQNNVPVTEVSNAARENVLTKIPAYIARFSWRKEGYYEVLNQTDPLIRLALEKIQ